MSRRKFSEVQIKRSVLKHIPKTENPYIKKAGIGDDCARLFLSEEKKEQLLVADGVCLENSLGNVKSDFIRLYNNLKAAGGLPYALTDTLLLPEADERRVKNIIKELTRLAGEYGITVIGGHTEISSACNEPILALTMFGSGQTAWSKQWHAGMDIVMSGFTGTLGTVLLTKSNRKQLLTRYSEDYLMTAEQMETLAALRTEIEIAKEADVCYAHDISAGGVYAALWELADGADVGIEVSHDAIPIRQETIEVCEFVGCNPYMIDGSGGVLYVTKDGEALSRALYAAGYEAAVIGHITDNKDRVVLRQEERSFLTPPDGEDVSMTRGKEV